MVDVVLRPAERRGDVGEGAATELRGRDHQLGRVGGHDRRDLLTLTDAEVAVADAELVVLRCRPGHAAHELVPAGGDALMAEHSRHRAAAERQCGEHLEEFVAGDAKVAEQLLAGGVDHLRNVFARADDASLHGARLDQVGEHDHAVAEPDAGVGDVEHQRLLGDAEVVVHEAGGGRLEEIPRHGAVDEGADLVGAKPRAVEGLAGGDGGHGAGRYIGRPHTPGAHAADAFQSARRNLQPLIGRRDPLLDLRGRQERGWEVQSERLHEDMLETKRNHHVLLHHRAGCPTRGGQLPSLGHRPTASSDAAGLNNSQPSI